MHFQELAKAHFTTAPKDNASALPLPHPSRLPLHINFMRHPRSCDATIPCLTERRLATGLYTKGAEQACAMRVTELGPSV